MGITIHYSLRSRVKSDARAVQLLEAMHRLAGYLPFSGVEPLRVLAGDDVRSERWPEDAPEREWLYDKSMDVSVPWNKLVHCDVSPAFLGRFTVHPGAGSESVELGLVRYPPRATVRYHPEDDRQFFSRVSPTYFSWRRWRAWCNEHTKYGLDRGLAPATDLFSEDREIPTRLSGYRWSSFCKTEYASTLRAGGPLNFLRVHASVVTLLERIGRLAGVTVDIEDEAGYGPFTRTVRPPSGADNPVTRARLPGHHSLLLLGQSIGAEWTLTLSQQAAKLEPIFAGSLPEQPHGTHRTPATVPG